MGFTEDFMERTGTELVWDEIRLLAGPDVWVLTPREWNCDTTKLARLIARNTDGGTRIVLSGYSWGAGYGFLRMVRALAKLNRGVYDAVLVDPVIRWRFTPNRPKWLAAATNPLSMVGITEFGRELFPIKIPASVRRVRYFRQREDVPAGRKLVAKDPKMTLINPAKWIQTGHGSIDDSALVRREILKTVKEAISDG